MSEDSSGNRRERRAAAKQSGKPLAPPSSAPNIKLQQPGRSGPKAKTLLDLYEDKKELLEKGRPFDKIHEDDHVRDESGNILEAGLGDGDPIGPVGNAVFWSISLAMVHFTLDVLAYNQYSQEIEWSAVLWRTLSVLPGLFLLLLVVSSKTAKRFPLARQIFFMAVDIGAGCYVIHIANTYDYYAVMKQAAPSGTLWIWSVIELDLAFAVPSLLVNLAFLWYEGYSII